MHSAGSLSKSDGGIAVESYPASTRQISFVSGSRRAKSPNPVSMNSGDFSFPKNAGGLPFQSPIPHENLGGGFGLECSQASIIQFSLGTIAARAESQNVDPMNSGVFSFPKTVDRPMTRSFIPGENLGGRVAVESSAASTKQSSLVSSSGRDDSRNVDSKNSTDVSYFPLPWSSFAQTSLASGADKVDIKRVDLPNLGVFSFPKTAAHPPPHNYVPHKNSVGGFASGCSPVSIIQTSSVSGADRVDIQNVDLPNSVVFSFPKTTSHPSPPSSIPHENSCGGFASECSPASTIHTSLVSGAYRGHIQNVEFPNLGVFSFPKAAAYPPPHSSIPHKNSGGGFASECSPASTVRFPLVCGSGSAELQNVDSMNLGDFAFPKPADRPQSQSSIHHENPSNGFDVESSSACNVPTSFVCSAGGYALSMNQHPAWFSKDIYSVSTGAPDLAKKDASICGTSTGQQQNMDRFPPERSILGEYIFQKLTDWRFKPHPRLSNIASGENLASSSDHDNLAVHVEQHNQQNKEAETHITSTSHGNYCGNVYTKRRKKRFGVMPEDGVRKNLSIKEQNIEAIGMESILIKHGIRMDEQLDKAVGMESTRIEQEDGVRKNLSVKEEYIEAIGMESTLIEHGIRMAKQFDKPVGMESTHIEQDDVQKGEGVEENISMEKHSHEAFEIELTEKDKEDVQKGEGIEENISVEKHSHEAFEIELTEKDKGHSDLVGDGEMRPGTEGAIVILNDGQQPESNNDVATMKRPSLVLPFVRRSPIWETVESLEIFQKFPQSPHFLPLIDASFVAREGLAIAKMVTFASTAEDAMKLSMNDPISRFMGCLETFHDLEAYGFDTKTLENHVTRLLSIKDMDQKKNEAETQVSKLQHSMVDLDKEIHETLEKMKVHQEELKSAMWQKEEKDLEIERLRASLEVLAGSIRRNWIEFEELNKSW